MPFISFLGEWSTILAPLLMERSWCLGTVLEFMVRWPIPVRRLRSNSPTRRNSTSDSCEWLSAQAASGYVTYDAETNTFFRLFQAQKVCLRQATIDEFENLSPDSLRIWYGRFRHRCTEE